MCKSLRHGQSTDLFGQQGLPPVFVGYTIQQTLSALKSGNAPILGHFTGAHPSFNFPFLPQFQTSEKTVLTSIPDLTAFVPPTKCEIQLTLLIFLIIPVLDSLLLPPPLHFSIHFFLFLLPFPTLLDKNNVHTPDTTLTNVHPPITPL